VEALQHPRHRLARHQRRVAIEDEDVAFEAGERLLPLQHGVSGAMLWVLDDDDPTVRRDQRLDLLASAPDHHDRVSRRQRVDGREQVVEHRSPRDRMEDLVQIGLHPRALAGGEDDGGDGAMGRHGRPRATIRLKLPDCPDTGACDGSPPLRRRRIRSRRHARRYGA
jgi:hypothetical protein